MKSKLEKLYLLKVRKPTVFVGFLFSSRLQDDNFIMVLKRIITILLLVFALKANSQTDTLESKVPLSFSYYGNMLVNKGFKLSGDWICLEIKKTKIKKKRTKVLYKGLYVTPNLFYYKHIKSHDGLQIGLDLLWRRSNSKGWYRELGSGYGYMRIYNVGETYTINSDGTSIISHKYKSRGYFTENFSFAIGRKIQLQKNSSLSPFLRLNTGFVYSYNSSILVNLSLELGVRFVLSSNPNRGEYLKIEKIKEKKRK